MVTIINKSEIVGRPLAAMLANDDPIVVCSKGKLLCELFLDWN